MFSGLSISDLVIIIVSLLISLACHEAMHAFAGHALGDTTAQEEGRLTINPLKHIDLFTTILLPFILIVLGQTPFFAAKPVPFNPYRVRWGEYGAALVGLAGPFTNLLLAALASVVLHLGGISIGTESFTVLYFFLQVNVGLFVFNMIPFPPLDGSRLLYAVAPDLIRRVMAQIEGFGFTTIIFFMLLCFPLISPIIANITTNITDFLLR